MNGDKHFATPRIRTGTLFYLELAVRRLENHRFHLSPPFANNNLPHLLLRRPVVQTACAKGNSSPSARRMSIWCAAPGNDERRYGRERSTISARPMSAMTATTCSERRI